MQTSEHGHDPVLVEQVLAALDPQPGQVALDCTLGRGGHALAILERLRPGGSLVALDVDPANLTYARQRLAGQSVRYFHANYAEAPDVLAEAGLETVDLLLADLGLSTTQFLEARYGMSFQLEGPLDMRLDPRIKLSAADLLARLTEAALADLLFENAQERFSRRIARKIVQTRSTEPIRTTNQLARLVRSVLPPPRHGEIDPATRTFQALRMAVNGELEHLQTLLEAIPQMMSPGGRVAIISFHSGEDRLVKQAARSWAAQGRCELLSKKPVEPDEAEIARNPRSRSAKLRAVRFLP